MEPYEIVAVLILVFCVAFFIVDYFRDGNVG